MSFVSSEKHPNPDDPNDPLYYAPRSVRSKANPRSNSAPHRSEDPFFPTTTRSRFDDMREEAFAKTMRDSLESEFVHEGRQPRLLLAVAGGMAAGIGVSVIAALVFFALVPKLQKSAPSELAVIAPASAEPAQTTQTTPEQSQALLQKFVQFRKSQGSNNPEHAVSEFRTLTPAGAAQTMPEESQALLQKFVQFRKSQGSNNPESAASEFRTLTPAGAAQKTPEESHTLLQKFEQWQKRQ